ncbi:hypothetical protein ECANGB1_1622 [Enterospora canceri]|uniref:Uncharacterized protein n=1 Tax=Enterospora canceri TaxID=1081671 RepID=A0A1Y1S5L4_9MICR|nr:hypothetical protein ECANGB1_1622 [Enterospora canceri]
MKTLIGFVFLLVHYCAYNLEIRLDYSIDDLYISTTTPGTILRLMDERRVLGFDEFAEDNFPNALVSSFANRYAINILNDYGIAFEFDIREYFDQDQNDIMRVYQFIEGKKNDTQLFGNKFDYKLLYFFCTLEYETVNRNIDNVILAAKVQYVIKHSATLNHSIKIRNNSTKFNSIKISRLNNVAGQRMNLEEYDILAAHAGHERAAGLIAVTKDMEVDVFQKFVNITVNVEDYTIKRTILKLLRLERWELNTCMDNGNTNRFLDRLIDIIRPKIGRERKVVEQLLLKLFTPYEIVMFLRSSNDDVQSYTAWWNVNHKTVFMLNYAVEVAALRAEMKRMQERHTKNLQIQNGFNEVFRKKLNLDKLNYSSVVEDKEVRNIPLCDDSTEIVEDNSRKRNVVYCAIGFTLIVAYIVVVLFYNIIMSRKNDDKEGF